MAHDIHPRPRTSAFFWVLLVAAGLMVGAGIALMARPLPQTFGWLSRGWVAIALSSAGFLGLVLALAGLLRRPPGSIAGRPGSGKKPPGKPTGADRVNTPTKALNAGEVAAFLLQEGERCLELLRHAATSSDRERLSDAINELTEWATRLSLERKNLTVNARKAKPLFVVRQDLTALHSEQLRRSGDNIEIAQQTAAELSDELENKQMEARLARFSSKLTRLGEQFEDRPEIRQGLSHVAQSLGAFLGFRRRTVDPSDPALAATLKLPDPTALDTVSEQIRLMEEAEAAGTPRDEGKLESIKRYMGNLAGALGPIDHSGQQPTLNELNSALHSAAESLNAGELAASRSHLKRAMAIMQESDLLSDI